MFHTSYHPTSSVSSTIYRTNIPSPNSRPNQNSNQSLSHDSNSVYRSNSPSAQFSTDPAVTGPGLWYRIHTLGAKCALTNDNSKIDRYIEEVEEIVNTS